MADKLFQQNMILFQGFKLIPVVSNFGFRHLQQAGSIPTAAQAIGYKELFPYFRGEVSLEEAVEAIKRESRRYAKRQITWFKREEQVEFLPIDAFPSCQALLEEAVSLLGKWGVWKGGNACEQ